MAIDQVDITPPSETIVRERPRLLFHGTSWSYNAPEIMTEIGLLAEHPTLTPSVETARTFLKGGYGFLTFWYPEKNELRKQQQFGHSPRLPLDGVIRQEMLKKIDSLNLQDFDRQDFEEFLRDAETYLPSSRLKAVARVEGSDVSDLISRMPSGERTIPEYAKNQAKIEARIKRVLDRVDIDFLDPDMDTGKLAHDIARSQLEHQLLQMGERIDRTAHYPDPVPKLESYLQVLQQTSFEDPVYERYRKILIGRVTKSLSR